MIAFSAQGVKAMQVMIVDDQRTTRAVLRGFLERHGHIIVRETSTGAETLAALEECRPDVVLLDVELPDMSGIEVARQIMVRAPVPVVMISAHEEDDLVLQATQAGIHAYLTKPIDGRDIQRALIVARARFEDMRTMQRLRQAAEQRAARLALAHDIVRYLAGMAGSAGESLPYVLQQVTERIQTQFGYYEVIIALIEDEALVITAAAGEQVPADKIGYRIPLYPSSPGLMAWVAQSGKTLLVPDVREDPRFSPCPWDSSTLCELTVPLCVGERILGILDIQSTQVDGLTQEDAEIMEILAGSLGAVIDNMRLVNELREHARRLEEANAQLITAREQLIRHERLAAIGQVAAAVQHEVSNPLTAVLGNAHWLAERADVPEEVRDILRVIARESLRIRDVLRQLDEVQDRLVPYAGGAQMLDLRHTQPPDTSAASQSSPSNKH
jgi:CheY-like chemotaxis protein